MNLPADASTDQSNCPPDYYRRNNGMLHQLDASQARGEVKEFTPNLTDAELITMSRERLSALLQSIDYKIAPSLLLSVIRETMDRIDGKPTQRIEQKIEHTGKMQSSELTNDQLVMALRKADVAGLLPPGVKLLGNGDVVVDADYTDVTKDQ
jgi:hypothetical protein